MMQKSIFFLILIREIHLFLRNDRGTEGGNRTHTRLPSLDFESSASTNSATSAQMGLCHKSVMDFGENKKRGSFDTDLIRKKVYNGGYEAI